MRLKKILLLFLFIPAFKPGQGQSLQLKNIHKEYSLHQGFVFELSNLTDSTLTYLTSLEILQEGGEWQEIRTDVFTYHTTKSAKVFEVAGKATKTNVFYPGKYISPSNKDFRLKISYGHDYRVNGGVIYSDKFKFIK